MKKTLPIIIIVLIIAGFGVAWKLTKKEAPLVTNFEECVLAGNPVMESYPRQCRHQDQTFVEYIGNELEKEDLIRLDTPRPNQVITSPLTITGEARGTLFFEASFPVVLTDWDGLIIAQGIATAKSDPIRADGASPISNGAGWMTSEFVPFEATLTFTVDKNTYSNRGALILQKDNPSGLPEHDDALEIPVVFAGITGNTPPPKACTLEAKQCPDGSYVSRTGPNCEFAACPGISPIPTEGKGIVGGTVTLGPTCPVERIPPDPKCADKPYQSTIEVRITGNNKIVATTQSDNKGAFQVSLSPGQYDINATSGAVFPRCSTSTVIVESDKTVTRDLSCDTGIR